MKNRNDIMEGYSASKMMIFVLIFLLTSMIIIFAFIIPTIKHFKVVKKEYLSAKSINYKIQKLKKNREKELKKLKRENLKILNAFANRFDEKQFLSFSKKHFYNATISRSNESNLKDEFIIYDFNVSTNIKTPVNFYRFLEDINRYENIVEADFPIVFEANKNIIYSSFKIKVYDLNDSK